MSSSSSMEIPDRSVVIVHLSGNGPDGDGIVRRELKYLRHGMLHTTEKSTWRYRGPGALVLRSTISGLEGSRVKRNVCGPVVLEG